MEQKKSGIKYPLHGAVAVAFCDGILIAFSYWVGLLARYDFTFSSIARSAVRDHAIYVLFVVAASLIIYYIFGLYGNVWRYAGVVEVEQAVKAYIMLVPVLLGLWIVLPLEVSRAAIFVGYVLSFLFSSRKESLSSDTSAKTAITFMGIFAEFLIATNFTLFHE